MTKRLFLHPQNSLVLSGISKIWSKKRPISGPYSTGKRKKKKRKTGCATKEHRTSGIDNELLGARI